MREIKFRGKPLEDYGDIKWFFGSLISSNDDKLAYIEADYQGTVPVEWDSVGQYTGLKDKNGKEIYEGDILQREIIGLRGYKIVEQITEVIFHNGGFCSKWHKKFEFDKEGNKRKVHQEKYIFDLPTYLEQFEIIGNIYENPELLEAAK
ncbi:putative phage protein (TIGR01671 family) [Cytobacillus firmus]|uniref:Putative phage protein (TIGR01671 family) n=2 Tax=Cytobacillus TaxID=2675230 RepID=A0A366JN75_CYTFI|nr:MULTISPECIES: YopX family protein [Cytobacillus]RBP89371.1 putative phage protein (TIGR01671 family) [Cytobacillus firmus]TDX47402.1 putative phage protein (TIGR01671 family) [Cytobacillus oceanisediminis]